MPKKPTTISSVVLYENMFTRIKKDILELGGRQWDQVYFDGPDKDGIAALPVTATGIYLLQQYRHPQKTFLWQLPGGILEDGYSQEEAMRKELKEEMGIEGGILTAIGSVAAEPGMSTRIVYFYVVKDFSLGENQTEYTEVGMNHRHFTWSEVEQMLLEGKIFCGFVLSALLQYKIRGGW